MEQYIKLFKKYPTIFNGGYFKWLYKELQKHIDNDTIQYEDGVLLTWTKYKRKSQYHKKNDIKINHMINETPGNGKSGQKMKEFISRQNSTIWLEVKKNNERAIKFYEKEGFKFWREKSSEILIYHKDKIENIISIK